MIDIIQKFIQLFSIAIDDIITMFEGIVYGLIDMFQTFYYMVHVTCSYIVYAVDHILEVLKIVTVSSEYFVGIVSYVVPATWLLFITVALVVAGVYKFFGREG